jgi:hypothetical protein
VGGDLFLPPKKIVFKGDKMKNSEVIKERILDISLIVPSEVKAVCPMCKCDLIADDPTLTDYHVLMLSSWCDRCEETYTHYYDLTDYDEPVDGLKLIRTRVLDEVGCDHDIGDLDKPE